MKPKGGFLRKAARLDKKRKAQHDEVKNHNINIDSQVEDIVNEGKNVIDDYSMVISAFAMKITLEKTLKTCNQEGMCMDELKENLNGNLKRITAYLVNVTAAMKKDM
jgi:hypothetical protein